MADYDAIVIGTGQAGPALARRLVAAGRKVAIIDEHHLRELSICGEADSTERKHDSGIYDQEPTNVLSSWRG